MLQLIFLFHIPFANPPFNSKIGTEFLICMVFNHKLHKPLLF